MSSLPYITSPGNIEKALLGIKTAQTPDRVTQDFVKTILKIRGGSGNQVASFLKKIGFVNADGTPSEVYGRFRNKATSGSAAFDALRFGYDSLFKRNEYMHKLSEEELRGLVIEETGQSDESSVPSLVVGSIAALKKFVNEGEFTLGKQLPIDSQPTPAAHFQVSQKPIRPFGMNLSYTINLNLPPTSDIAVFNAIFKSLKENLLRGTDDE